MKKRKVYRVWNYRPTKNEGAYIQFLLKCQSITCCDIATTAGLSRTLIANVLAGRRHSAKVEAEIARVLGYPSWNEMIETIRKNGLAA